MTGAEHHAMVRAARLRAVVRLTDGREGRLMYWPLPREHRRHVKHRTGGRVKVVIGGRHELVSPEEVAHLLPRSA